MPGGLDGIAIDLPALDVTPTHGDVFPLNIQVKDPLWPLRNMLDVSFSVKPGEPHTLWLDTRDRILPERQGAVPDDRRRRRRFRRRPRSKARELRLVFKPREEARRRARRSTASRRCATATRTLVEERPNTRRLDLYTRFEADLTDLLRVDPDHALGRQYWYDYNRSSRGRRWRSPPRPPACRCGPSARSSCSRYVKRFVNWYIDHRQIENGEFGGGLSDDGDLTNCWPGDGVDGRARRTRSATRCCARWTPSTRRACSRTACRRSRPTSCTATRRASRCSGSPCCSTTAARSSSSARWRPRPASSGSPASTPPAIATSARRTSAARRCREEGVWGWSKPSSYLILHPALELVEFNGSPRVRKWLLELADGLLAHRKPDAERRLRASRDGRVRDRPDLAAAVGAAPWPLFWAAYRWTGDRKYLQPFLDAGPRSLAGHSRRTRSTCWACASSGGRRSLAQALGSGDAHFAWQVSGDTQHLERLYAEQIEASAAREYINTEGSLWIDRVTVPDAETAARAPRRRRAGAQLDLSRPRRELGVRRPGAEEQRRHPRARGDAAARADHRLQPRQRRR